MQKMTGAEFVALAHTARGFGPGGAYTLVEWIRLQVATLRVLDSVNNVQASINNVQATLARGPPPT